MSLRTEERQLRILMTADAVGGVWSYALDLVRQLAPCGVHVLLAVMGPAPDKSQQEEAAAIRNLNLVAKPFELEWYRGVSDIEIARSGDWLHSLASSFRPDIVHINGYAHAMAQWSLPTVVVAHSCVYSWWSAVHGSSPPNDWTPYRNRVIAALGQASTVVAPTAWMLRTLQQSYGVSLRASKVIRNFSSVAAASVTKEPFIFACGRLWDEAKNMALLARIAVDLDWPLHIAGSLADPQGAGVLLPGARLDGMLSRSEVIDKLARASIFAHPVKYEPFGLAVLEAAQSGCALVLADISPLRELWDGCAIFIPPQDAKQWTQCLNRLVHCSATRDDLSKKALNRSAEYNTRSAAAQYFSVYNGLAHQSESALYFSPSQINEALHQTFLPLRRF